MDVLNKEKDDFSYEVLIQLSIALEAVWAAEIIAYRVADTLDRRFIKNTLFQQKKSAFLKARTMLQKLIAYLEVTFDGDFSAIMGKERMEGKTPADLLTKNANDMVQLLLIYFGRGDMDWNKRDSMKKALMNFKPLPGIDLDSILKFYNFKLD